MGDFNLLKPLQSTVCKEICDSIKSVIKSSLEELHKHTKFNIGFYSTCDENQASQKNHIAIIRSKDSGVPLDMTCIDCGYDVYPLKKEHMVWFTEVRKAVLGIREFQYIYSWIQSCNANIQVPQVSDSRSQGNFSDSM